MSISICPADNWWAIFEKNGKTVKAKVAFFEVESTEVTTHRAMVYHPGQMMLVDALAVPQFEDLVYEPSTDPSRKVTKADLLQFLKDNGAHDEESDLKGRVNDGLVRRAVELYTDEVFEDFVTREEL